MKKEAVRLNVPGTPFVSCRVTQVYDEVPLHFPFPPVFLLFPPLPLFRFSNPYLSSIDRRAAVFTSTWPSLLLVSRTLRKPSPSSSTLPGTVLLMLPLLPPPILLTSFRDEILLTGGSISHHHGVGKHRKTYMRDTIGDVLLPLPSPSPSSSSPPPLLLFLLLLLFSIRSASWPSVALRRPSILTTSSRLAISSTLTRALILMATTKTQMKNGG